MGQKVNPRALRIGINQPWVSHWLGNKKNFSKWLIEDYKIRKFLKNKLFESGVPQIEIRRDSDKVWINIFCAKPGRVIGEGGKNIEQVRLACEQLINQNNDEKKSIYINVVEVKNIDTVAQLIAEGVALQLEKRASFRRVMKQSIQRAMSAGTLGIKIMVSGRLGGAEIARTEHYHEGTIPLHTLRADIDYGFAEANTTYGKIGVRVWVYRGMVLKKTVLRKNESKVREEGGRG
ncbi:MAG: 30S ribosomal protein S3 [Oscillospiraceae bacterium]|jgi:small subunit ribosomal protein S3|nr:30S ribosomal protein S3 [Oscillospiraceae bacterium]